MKKTIEVNMDKGYTLEEVINDRVDCGAKWAELSWFDENYYLSGNFYYFSNYYGSEGGYYNEDKDVLIPSWDIDDMDEKDFIDCYGAGKDEIVDDSYFVEYPIDRELSELHVGYRYENYKSEYYNELYNEEVIKDEDGLNYWDGSGIYQYIDGLFYEVELVDKD